VTGEGDPLPAAAGASPGVDTAGSPGGVGPTGDAAQSVADGPHPGDAVRPAFGGARVERVAAVDPRLHARLLRIWTDVSNAGGWVGFVPPVVQSDVEPALDAALQRVHHGRDWLIVVRAWADPTRPLADDGAASDWHDVAGFAFVAANDRLLSEHWRWVLRVQVHPEHQGSGLGAVLLDGLGDMAEDAGLEMLHLTVRGGEGLESFYARAGYHEVARIPGAIRVAPGDDRDQVVLVCRLGERGTPRGS
jgi:GNAT superfamily N-acetyltransferase